MMVEEEDDLRLVLSSSEEDKDDHGKEIERRRIRQERSEQVVNKSMHVNTLAQVGSGDRMERGSVEGGKMGVVEHIAERSKVAETAARPATQVSMPGTANTAFFPSHSQHIVPFDHVPHPSMVTAVPQQLLQQQLHQQQLAFQQQQQLMILKQQQQNAPVPVMRQQLVSDRDRQIALLEQELKVQKMMMEVERREAIVREQARILTVQADRMRMEQEQLIRSQLVPPSGISSTALEQAWTVNGLAGGHHEAPSGRAADGGVDVSEKVKLERMFQEMIKARKEELEKAVVVKEGTRICDKAGRRVGSQMDLKLVDGGKYRKGDVNYPDGTLSSVIIRKETSENNIVVRQQATNLNSQENGKSSSTQRQENGFLRDGPRVSDDVLSLNDEASKEQLKIMEEIRARNEEKRKQEEMTIKLITKLSLDEEEQLLPDRCDGAAAVIDSWPDLREAGGRMDGFRKDSGLSVEEAFRISSQQSNSEENEKLASKMIKKNEKLKRERTKSEAMGELEIERKKAADELKLRLGAQEREQFSRMVVAEGKRGEHSVSKKRNKTGK